MRFLLLAAIAFAPLAVRAQVLSVYGTFSDSHISGLINGNAINATGSYSTTTQWEPGFGLGATFGVLPVGPIHLGFDVRYTSKAGNNGDDLILAGPRLALKVPVIHIKPYIQASGGYLRTRTTLINSPLPLGTQERANFAAWEILGGLDYPLLRILDLRLVEIGGGRGYNVNAAGVNGVYNVSLLTINSGLVFHF